VTSVPVFFYFWHLFNVLAFFYFAQRFYFLKRFLLKIPSKASRSTFETTEKITGHGDVFHFVGPNILNKKFF